MSAGGKSAELSAEGLYEALRTIVNDRSHCQGCTRDAITWLLVDYIASCPNEGLGDKILAEVLRDLPGLIEQSRKHLAADDGVGRPVGHA